MATQVNLARQFRPNIEIALVIAITVVVLIMGVAVVVKVPVMAVVPSMVVFDAAVRTIPISCKELVPVVMGLNPTCAGIRWPCPIAVMPCISPASRIPIASHPYVVRPWPYRRYMHNARCGRRPNSDSHRNLRAPNRTAT